MGCGASSPVKAAQPSDPNDRSAVYKAGEPTTKEEAPQQEDVAAKEERVAQEIRASPAAGRIKEKCPDGWLDAAIAYCACLERGEEWGSNPKDQALRDKVGDDFEEMKNAFESFDIDGDRHVDIDELASALETIGQYVTFRPNLSLIAVCAGTKVGR